MKNKTYDLIVIGAGSAGSTAAKAAARQGHSVALLERDRLGGTCLNYGCDPTKTLLHIAHMLHAARNGGPAVSVHDVAFDWQASQQHVRDIINEIRGGTHEDAIDRQQERGIDVYLGQAAMVSAHDVRVADQVLTGNQIIIAIGYEPVIPPGLGLGESGYYTNKTLLELPRLPESIAILGAGPVGTEFAQMLARFGARVTLLEMKDHILPKDDPELTEQLEACLRDEGIDVQCQATVENVRSERGRHCVTWSRGTETKATTVDLVLVTTGRKPDLSALSPENAGIELRDGSIVVDKNLRTSIPHIWAAGDVTDTYPFTHVASAQAAMAVRNAFADSPEVFDYRGVPWATYTEPALAHVGCDYTHVAANADSYETVQLALPETPRALLRGIKTGIVKLTREKESGLLASADILAPNADELIAVVALAIRQKMPASALAEAVFPYPTLSQAWIFAAKRF